MVDVEIWRTFKDYSLESVPLTICGPKGSDLSKHFLKKLTSPIKPNKIIHYQNINEIIDYLG